MKQFFKELLISIAMSFITTLITIIWLFSQVKK